MTARGMVAGWLATCAGILVLCGSASAFNPAFGVLPRGSRNNNLGVLGLKAQRFTAPSTLPDVETLGKVAQELAKTLQYAAQKPIRAQYSTAIAARFSFFLAQGVGVALTGLNDGSLPEEEKAKYRSNDRATSQAASRTLDPAAVIGALTDAILSESDTTPLPLENVMMKDKPFLESDEQRALFNKNFQSIVQLIKSDLKNIEDDVYKFPYDMELGYAPQWSPVPVLRSVNTYLEEKVKTIDRMFKKDGLEVRRNFKAGATKYPDYYLQNFHYQSDGWLSERSAYIYDYQVESLFIGMADAMRRQVVPFFSSHIKGIKARGVAEGDIKVLDVATGTGRFAAFLLQNFPGLNMEVLDLSPFYLAESKKLLSKYSGVTYVEAAAEHVPASDAEYDVITCVYLFHELPQEVRTQVVKEWFRVLKPGGKIFFVDSAQQGDVAYDRVLEGFTIIAHEPYYLNYTEQNLGKLFEDAGFHVDTTQVHWVSKCMVMTKPVIQDRDRDSQETDILEQDQQPATAP